jgi:hypothetical protein
MFDYRVHRLYWLAWLPFRAIYQLSKYGALFWAIKISLSTSYGTLAKIVIAYSLWELILLVLVWVFRFFLGCVKRIIFKTVTVIPAIGGDAEEAQFVVLYGPRYFSLEKKLRNEIENWTPADTKELASFYNWRARLLFSVRERIERTVTELKRIHKETGRQPLDAKLTDALTLIETLHKQLGEKPSWPEKALVPQRMFNGIIGLTLIVLVIGYAIPHGWFVDW